MKYPKFHSITHLEGNTVKELSKELQTQIEDLYRFIRHSLNPSMNKKYSRDEVALEISKRASTSNSTPQYQRYLPYYYARNHNGGLECTLSSALVKLAFNDIFHDTAYTFLIPGHQVTCYFTKDKGLVVYDAATLITNNKVTKVFAYEFLPEELSLQPNSALSITPSREIPQTDLWKQHHAIQGMLLASNTHVHLATIIRNLIEYAQLADQEELLRECRKLLAKLAPDDPHLLLKNTQ